MTRKPYPKLHTHCAFTPANPQPKMPNKYAITTTVKSMFYNNLLTAPHTTWPHLCHQVK